MIEGQVAQVLNSRELVINRGDAHGVRNGMVFAVFDPAETVITDPETDKSLGSVYRPKVEVKIVEVQPHMSVGRTVRRIGGRTSGILGTGSIASLLYGSEPQVQTLRADDALWEPITEAESYIKRGDAVRQLVEP